MRLTKLSFLIIFCFCSGCQTKHSENKKQKPSQYITVLGIAQDAGYPQINCEKECCQLFHQGLEDKKMVSCLGLVDLNDKKKWLFDATPDLSEQLEELKANHLDNNKIIDGVFLTHAHIGHYTGLMYFGHEALGANNIEVYAMPRMKDYLSNNGPWGQLVSYKNIVIRPLTNDSTISLNNNLKVTPFLVPHRDEYSETVGYKIEGKNKSALFIPDINKWPIWNKNIIEEVKKVDYAFLDASFFKDGELKRDMSKIPHPFTSETTTLFENETIETKSKIYFIHFNHTNPTILDNHKLKDSIQNLGFNFAKEGMIFPL
ncbi:MBL fold metallo-hydrolase [Yeosuana sp. MJ-SS3]|uniref:MBL fold metallo-hydrolase n=1 Tax=Gilvirhabdus luticola TaxID=3079858 RepID=A0ABU3U6N5_9FLAO|nr:MBL fold metallo-hydrolase [Yeosuana sp. MJ-SS3]MDU8886060.1 MBL fold metallo-hydrolase [Yeosuana sp. MJ-SS3]